MFHQILFTLCALAFLFCLISAESYPETYTFHTTGYSITQSTSDPKIQPGSVVLHRDKDHSRMSNTYLKIKDSSMAEATLMSVPKDDGCITYLIEKKLPTGELVSCHTYQSAGPCGGENIFQRFEDQVAERNGTVFIDGVLFNDLIMKPDTPTGDRTEYFFQIGEPAADNPLSIYGRSLNEGPVPMTTVSATFVPVVSDDAFKLGFDESKCTPLGESKRSVTMKDHVIQKGFVFYMH